jgi:hypothetical protein
MVYRGYECHRFNDDQHEDPKKYLERYKGTKFTLVTADHMNLAYNDNSYTTKDFIKIIKPVKSIFTMHDLAIHAVTDDLSPFDIILLPHSNWSHLFKHKRVEIVGYPRFIHAYKTNRYKSIFFVSSVYILIKRAESEIINNFKFFLDNDVHFKFPKFQNIQILEDMITRNGGHVIDHNIESFQLLLQTDIAFSNASSSMCVEASIAGCHSINIGYNLENFYNDYNVRNHLSFSNIEYQEYCNTPPPPPRLDHLFDMEKAINLIVS